MRRPKKKPSFYNVRRSLYNRYRLLRDAREENERRRAAVFLEKLICDSDRVMEITFYTVDTDITGSSRSGDFTRETPTDMLKRSYIRLGVCKERWKKRMRSTGVYRRASRRKIRFLFFFS